MRQLPNYILFVIAIFFQINAAVAQFGVVDSLERALLDRKIQPAEKVDILIKLSELYLSRNQATAISYSNQAITIAEGIDNKVWLGYAFRSMGNCYSYQGGYDSAVFFLNRALKFNPDDATALYYLGQNEWYNGTEDKCLVYYKRAEEVCLQTKDLKTLAIVCYSYADYYRYRQKDSLAQYYVSLSIKILEKSNLSSDLATAYNIQAEMYRTEGHYKEALETYIKTARIAYQVLDSTRIGYCFSRMGYIYYMQNDFELAEKYLIRSLDIAEKVNGRNLKLFCLKALADMFSNLGNKKKCLYYADLCIQEGIEMNDGTAIGLAYSSLSTLYFGVGEMDSASVYADKGYRVSKENDDPINLVNSILNKVSVELELNNYSKVIDLTSEGIEIANFTQAMEHLKDLYKFRYKAYEKLNNKMASFEAFDKYKMYQDLLSNDNVDLGMRESQLEMNYQDKHLSDTLVYIENAQIAKQEILLQKQRSKFASIMGLIITVLLSAIIFIVYTTSRKRKKLNLSLAESNHDKELLLKEIHHRVKNSLQVVSSLLNLQKSQSNHKSFNELIDESQVKIGNIAIVHELLYQSSSFQNINLRQYIDKLGNHIMQTLSDSNKQIKIEKDIEDIEISLDKSVPLALVVNEIVTNSVKYAFKDFHKGVINITCTKKEGRVEVRISDNGPGLPADQLKSSKGIGITLIQGFIKQLKGELDYGNNNGAFFVFSFPDTNPT